MKTVLTKVGLWLPQIEETIGNLGLETCDDLRAYGRSAKTMEEIGGPFFVLAWAWEVASEASEVIDIPVTLPKQPGTRLAEAVSSGG